MKLRSIWILPILGSLGTVWFVAHSMVWRSSAERLSAASVATTVPWGPLFGRDYFVSPSGDDHHQGSAAQPWATLQHAAEQVGPGSTVHVLPGVYRGPVLTKQSGQRDKRIRFLSEKQWQARVITAGESFVWRNNGSYVDIAGFDISGDGAYGILNMGSNVRIIGNYVHDIAAPGCTSEGGAGIDNGDYSGHDNDVVSNRVERIGDRSLRCNRVHGIYHSNYRGHIWNNISCDNQGWGIHLWHAANAVVIANNLVCGNGEGGIVIGSGDASGAPPADHMLVTNNILIDNGRPDATFAIDEFGSLGDDNHYLNNLIFGPEQKIVLKNHNQIAGTIWKDPLLVHDKSAALGEYRLKANSPAIGAGTSAGAPPLDLEGRVRPVSGRWDIGPFEYKSEGKPWPWY